MDPVFFDQLAAAVRRSILFESLADLAVRYAEVFSHGYGYEDVGQVVVTDELGMDGTGGRALCDLDVEKHGVPLHGYTAGIVGVMDTIGDDMGNTRLIWRRSSESRRTKAVPPLSRRWS